MIEHQNDVLDGVVIRTPKAYPAYFGSYDQLPELVDFLNEYENLFLMGRNGMHRYNNQDHSMLSAMECVKNIAEGRSVKDNIWNINTEKNITKKKCKRDLQKRSWESQHSSMSFRKYCAFHTSCYCDITYCFVSFEIPNQVRYDNYFSFSSFRALTRNLQNKEYSSLFPILYTTYFHQKNFLSFWNFFSYFCKHKSNVIAIFQLFPRLIKIWLDISPMFPL